MQEHSISRRELLGTGVAAGAGLALQRASSAPAAHTVWRTDFATTGDGEGWPGWRCTGVANLGRSGGVGRLEAGSDVFPCDPRPVAFALDRRVRDAEIAAELVATGAAAGVVLRRTGPRTYYAAVLDDERGELLLLRRTAGGLRELARRRVARRGPLRLELRAHGAHPTTLTATLVGEGSISAQDATPALQVAGDPGVLATARTLLPGQGPPVLPALGHLRLLAYGVQEGQVVLRSPAGEAFLDAVRERSTAVFAVVEVRTAERPGPTVPSVVAAVGGAPTARGARLRVSTDVPARVTIEVATEPTFRRPRRLGQVLTDELGSAIVPASGLPAGRRVFWRARLRRRGRTDVGPVRSFRVLPRAGTLGAATIAIGSCASQFGPVFDRLFAEEPDLLPWQGDLNYPDTVGPLAQTTDGYAGIWRDFLANPLMAPVFERALFAAQRDDHDYGVQDANATNLVPWRLAPWESLVERRTWYRFAVGPAEFWVLDQRRHKSDPGLPDTPDKTLLGTAQRAWLLRTLAASKAPFKVLCSPCTQAPLGANQRDGSWAAGFTAERDLLLAHLRDHVSGQALFVTGDTHWTLAYERDGLFEVRPCPLGIPTPNDITIADPLAAARARRVPGVLHADDAHGHVALVRLGAAGGRPRLDLSLLREDGATVFHRRFVR